MAVNQPLSIAVSLLLTSMIGFVGAEPPSGAPVSDKAQVTEAMNSMYVAAASDDLAKCHAVAASDFYAFDNGKRFTGDALMELVKTAHAAGLVYVWHVTEPQVHIDGIWLGSLISIKAQYRMHPARRASPGWNPLFLGRKRAVGASSSFTALQRHE